MGGWSYTRRWSMGTMVVQECARVNWFLISKEVPSCKALVCFGYGFWIQFKMCFVFTDAPFCHITICWSKVYHFTTFLGATWSASPHYWLAPWLLLVSRFLKTQNFLHGLMTSFYLVRWQRCAASYGEENLTCYFFCDMHFNSWLCAVSSSYS